jgi:hypothetical protein
MMLTELIAELVTARLEHGDMLVEVRDASGDLCPAKVAWLCEGGWVENEQARTDWDKSLRLVIDTGADEERKAVDRRNAQ